MRYRIKESVKLSMDKKNGETLFALFMNQHLELTIETNEILLDILHLIDENNTDQVIFDKINSRYNDIINKQEFQLLITELLETGIIESKINNNLLYPDHSFLSRQLNFLSEYSDLKYNQFQLQNSISNSTVVIMGLGAIGSWIAYNLVQSGIKNLHLIDDDTVDISNISRQALYFQEDIGEYKVNALKKHLNKIISNLNIKTYKLNIEKSSDLNILPKNIDLFINCADYPNAYSTGNLVTNFCFKRNIIHINGIGYRGNICKLGLTTIPYKSICWNCLNQKQNNSLHKKELEFTNHKATAGSTATITTLIASIHSLEAIKILSPNMNPTLLNNSGELNLNTLAIKFEDKSDIEKCIRCSNGIGVL